MASNTLTLEAPWEKCIRAGHPVRLLQGKFMNQPLMGKSSAKRWDNLAFDLSFEGEFFGRLFSLGEADAAPLMWAPKDLSTDELATTLESYVKPLTAVLWASEVYLKFAEAKEAWARTLTESESLDDSIFDAYNGTVTYACSC